MAARVFGGDALAPGCLQATSERMSTEDLYAHVLASSNAFKQYVELSEQLAEIEREAH